MSPLLVITEDGYGNRIAVAVVRTLTSSAPGGLAWKPTHPGRARTKEGAALPICGGYGDDVEA